MSSFVALGLELNVDYASAVVLDLTGTVVFSSSRPGGTRDDLRELAVSALSRHVGTGATDRGRDRRRPRPGAQRRPGRGRGRPTSTSRAPELADDLAPLVGGGRVEVSNDANCAAYAESHHGAARGVDHALYITGTVGIGAGIVAGRSASCAEASGFAGEVGHMPVGDSDAPCGCGRRGCWEASIGMHAMLAAVGLPELDTPLRTAESVADRAAGDPSVRAGLERIGQDLGLGLAMLSSVLDPQVVVLGGYFVPLGELVLGAARRTLDERLASSVQVRPELRLSTLGIQAAALGAAEQSLGPIFSGDLELAG